MARSYESAGVGGGNTVPVPRWVVVGLLALFVLFFVRSFISPPEHLLQRLDAPGQLWTAQLLEVRHTRRHLEVRVRHDVRWESKFLSDPLPVDHAADWRERLIWSRDGKRLYLSLQGNIVWGYDASSDQLFRGEGLKQAVAADNISPVPLP